MNQNQDRAPYVWQNGWTEGQTIRRGDPFPDYTVPPGPPPPPGPRRFANYGVG
jgi:hypothetical protein